MALISAERFNALKAEVKAECQRRSYTGSVTSYAGSDYDFTVVPAAGVEVTTEHYEKIAVPLNAITGDVDVDSHRVISENEMAAMEDKVAALANIDKSSTSHGCAASCTGLCSSACSGTCRGTCSGCSGCGSGCARTCTGTCSGGCSGSCTGSCDNSCTGCTGACSTACTNNCDYWCKGTCGNNCGTACTHACAGSCSGGCTGTSK